MKRFVRFSDPYWIFKILFFISFGALLTLLSSFEFFSFNAKREGLYDTFVKLKGEREPDKRIVLVTITKDLYEQENTSWPLPLFYHTKVLDYVLKAGARSVGIDFHLSYDGEEDKKSLEELCSLVGTSDRIAWGREIEEDGIALWKLPNCLRTGTDTVYFQLMRKGEGVQDRHKTVRWFYGYYKVLRWKYKSLDLAVAGNFLGRDLSSDKRYEDEQHINFVGPTGSYPRIPVVDILSGRADPSIFKDKIVLYGVEDGLNDNFYHSTPLSRDSEGNLSMPRLEIHANIVDGILNRQFIDFSSENLTRILTFIVATVTCALVFTTSPMPGIVFLVFEFLVLVLLAFVSLKGFNYYIDILHPLLSVFILYYIFIPYRLIKEYKARWKIEEEVKLMSKVEELKTNFLSLMTHDLKTPIARIQGLAEVMLDHGDLAIQQRGHVETIIKSCDEFMSFINKILHFTKIESSGVNLNLQSKDINKLIQESVEMLHFDAEAKEISLVAELEPLFPIRIDVDLVKQVVKNLIENAIKYSPPGREIRIETRDLDSQVEIRIIDQGMGIPEKDRENIFLKFYRIRDDRLAMAKGTGLGLFLVKYFIELHKGKIAVESEEGVGSTFIVTLPSS